MTIHCTYIVTTQCSVHKEKKTKKISGTAFIKQKRLEMVNKVSSVVAPSLLDMDTTSLKSRFSFSSCCKGSKNKATHSTQVIIEILLIALGLNHYFYTFKFLRTGAEKSRCLTWKTRVDASLYLLMFQALNKHPTVLQLMTPVVPQQKNPTVWHSRLWSFRGRDTKLEKFLARNQL